MPPELRSRGDSVLASRSATSDFTGRTTFFFFNATATTEIYTLSLHDALPICTWSWSRPCTVPAIAWRTPKPRDGRSEEHTSELQSQFHLVCRLLLEKKKIIRPLRPHDVYHLGAQTHVRLSFYIPEYTADIASL